MPNNAIVESKFLPPAKQELMTDLDYSRKNIQQLLATGEAALVELAEIALQSQNAKTYEALFSALAKMGELNERLINVSDKKSKTGDDTPEKGPVTNNLFVGTPADLQKLLEDLNKKNV